MPKPPRHAPGGIIFHCINRGNARSRIFDDDGDYAAFERVLGESLTRVPVRLLAYCLMPNHWHLILWPSADGQLPAFMHWLTVTHVRRWHAHQHTEGAGHLYQGTYKSFPVQDDGHYLVVARYVERNPLRAKLVERAEDWRWSSLWAVEHGQAQQRGLLSQWPVARPADWVELVNIPQSPAELEAVRVSVRRGRPYGQESWQRQTAGLLALEASFRPQGRPAEATRGVTCRR